MSNFKKYTANPFYMSNSLMILLFFTGWGIWWSFFQIWLTTKQGFSGTQVGTIYSFNSAITLILMFVYGSLQDKLGIKKNLLIFCVSCEVFLGPFFTWVYVPLLKSNFIVGALIGSIYLSVAFLAASPTFEALAERMSRRFGFEYGQARAWGSFGYAVAALIAGFMFTLNAYLIFWIGSVFSIVLLLVLLFIKPENDTVIVTKYESKSNNQDVNNSPSLLEILSVFKMPDLWKIVIFISMSWISILFLINKCFLNFSLHSLEQKQQVNKLMVFLIL